jgi:endonuclease/exonuclease/phosphatase family metal-dependent hydrolase
VSVAKAFSVVSWNVEHLNSRGVATRVPDVAEKLLELDPDVVAIYEVEGKQVWRELMDGMPGYSFFITEGQNTQHILLGTSGRVTTFVTQKVEFRSRDAFMRPGALLTTRIDGHDYTLLFLHLASMPDPRGFGLRTDMVDRALEFKKQVVNRVNPAERNFIFLGDLNSMGLDYVYGREEPPSKKLLRRAASGADEIERLAFVADKAGMRILPKTHAVTWRDARRTSNLDHVVASKHLKFTKFDGGAEVRVTGWPELTSKAEQLEWIKRYSDHAILYFEVERLS